jgi:hypothetical protein
LNLQQRAREAHLKELRELEEGQQRTAEAHYQRTAEASARALTNKLKEVLGITPKDVHILKGPGSEGIAIYLEDGLAFCAHFGKLRVTHERTDQPYPAREDWCPIGNLAHLGAYLKARGPAEAEPEGEPEGVSAARSSL